MWDTTKLGNVLKLEYGKGLPKRDRNNQGNYPVYGSNGIVGYHDDFLIDFPCLIVGRKGAAGEVHISEKKSWPIDTTYYVKAPKDWNLRFLFYLLKSLKLEQHDRSTAIPGLNRNDAYDLEIPTPPLPTQHRIVEKIEELFSELDHGVENLKKAQQQLKTYRQAVLKDAFEGKLTKEWREQQTDLPTPEELLEQIKTEREAHRAHELAEWEKEVQQWEKDGKKGRKPRKPRMSKELDPVGEVELNELPAIPENWEYIRIGNIGNVGTGATPLKKENSYYENGAIPWVTSGALNNEYVREASDFVTKKALDETNLSLFPKHTLLVALYGEGKTRGKCSELLIEATTNQAIAAIVQNKAERKTKDFLKYFLLKNYNDIRRMSSGGVQPNLNLGIIENTVVPLAPEEEQQEIVNEIESRLSVVDQLEQTINENLQKAEALRQSILKKAFSGELIV